jgi:hypothetical protein
MGDPIVYVTILKLYSMLNIYKISGINNIYLTSNLELISICYYGFSVNDVRPNSWNKPSSLKAAHFYVNISNDDRDAISGTQITF